MKNTDHKIYHQSKFSFSRMAILYLRKKRLTILYAMFNFIGFLFSLLKGVYNICAIYTQVNKQAGVARILFAWLFGIFSTLINKALWDAQIKENNTKLSTTPNTDESRNDTTTTPTAPQLQNLSHDHPLLLLPQNLRNIALANLITSRSNYPQSPTEHKITLQSNIDDT